MNNNYDMIVVLTEVSPVVMIAPLPLNYDTIDGSFFMQEIWKNVKGYEGIYQVSNTCKIRSLDRDIKYKNGSVRFWKGKELKPYLDGRGYYKVGLYKNGKMKGCFVHRLVAYAFIKNEFNKPHINHINGIKTDNSIDNLEWCTNAENIAHAVKNNLRDTSGENSNFAKLTALQVSEIKYRLSLGEKMTHIAVDYDVTISAINGIKRGLNWVKIKPMNEKEYERKLQ